MNNNFKPTASGYRFSALLQYPGAHCLHSRATFDISHTLKILSEKTFTNIRGKCCVQYSATKVTESAGLPNVSV